MLADGRPLCVRPLSPPCRWISAQVLGWLLAVGSCSVTENMQVETRRGAQPVSHRAARVMAVCQPKAQGHLSICDSFPWLYVFKQGYQKSVDSSLPKLPFYSIKLGASPHPQAFNLHLHTQLRQHPSCGITHTCMRRHFDYRASHFQRPTCQGARTTVPVPSAFAPTAVSAGTIHSSPTTIPSVNSPSANTTLLTVRADCQASICEFHASNNGNHMGGDGKTSTRYRQRAIVRSGTLMIARVGGLHFGLESCFSTV